MEDKMKNNIKGVIPTLLFLTVLFQFSLSENVEKKSEKKESVKKERKPITATYNNKRKLGLRQIMVVLCVKMLV